GTTRAVYPYQITYGAGGDKVQVLFEIVPRAINGTIDISRNDTSNNNDIYQNYRIDRIDVKRKQSSGAYTTLRSYRLNQSYSITLITPTRTPGSETPTPTATDTPFPHLTLDSIVPMGVYTGTN